LFKEGALGDAAFVVNTGWVEVRKSVSGGGETVIAKLGPNSVVGEMALLTETPRSATVVAIDDADLLEIPKAAFDALLKRQSIAALKVCHNLAVMLSERLQLLNREVVRLTAELATHRSPEEVEQFKKLLSQWSF
jgi:CRP-like cAMP-binding protein